MYENDLYWMQLSISLANKTSSSELKVGSVLVSDYNELICFAYTGEKNEESWNAILIDKIQGLNITRVQSLYLTINTWSEYGSFGLSELLKEIYIDEIYIGLPDPRLSYYLNNDPALSFKKIYRYTDEMQYKILEQNYFFYSKSKQSIRSNPFFSENRISNLVINKLRSKGFNVSLNELQENKQRQTLARLISRRYGIEYLKTADIVSNVISEAFDDKYSSYNYIDDARSLDVSWKDHFMSCYQRISSRPLPTNRIINIGVGSGYEAIALFSNCHNVTFVDIARGGLDNIKAQMPAAKIIVSSADDLSSIPNNSYDLYVSLRTYNSSFFEIKKAIFEARRVLKQEAVIIVSIANSFLYIEQNCIIPGLIVPGTEFVDIYRGMDTIKLIHTELLEAGFKDIRFFSTNTELYLSAISA